MERSRSAMLWSMMSPPARPKVSLMSWKPSISISAKTTKRDWRSAIISSRRSSRMRRFGSPVRTSCVVNLRTVSRLRANAAVSRRVARSATKAQSAKAMPTAASSPHSQFIVPTNARSGAQLNQPMIRPCPSCSDCTSRPRSLPRSLSNRRSFRPARRSISPSSPASKRPTSPDPVCRSTSAACNAACCSVARRLSWRCVSIRPTAAQAIAASARNNDRAVPARAPVSPGNGAPAAPRERRRAQCLRASAAAVMPTPLTHYWPQGKRP